MDVILRDGLRPMARQFVHLTPDVDLARRVGAHDAGHAFYRANERFWLADEVPAEFVRREWRAT